MKDTSILLCLIIKRLLLCLIGNVTFIVCAAHNREITCTLNDVMFCYYNFPFLSSLPVFYVASSAAMFIRRPNIRLVIL